MKKGQPKVPPSPLVPDINREVKAMFGAALDKVADEYPRLFMGMAHHRTTSGDKMTFGDKPWLRAIYQDNSHNMVIIKCSQVGLTEHALCGLFTWAKAGKRGMYILPSNEHRRSFVADRVNKMQDYSDLYRHAVKDGESKNDADNNVYKTIFGSGWKFVGSNVRKSFFEFPCSVLMFDEYDELDQDNILYAYDRVANEANPVIWKFGNPTRDNWGIHKEFLLSDQKEWHVACDHCNTKQVLDWYSHFVIQDDLGGWALRSPSASPVCTSCGKEFNRLGPGEWIAANPNARVSGYRISRLFVDKQQQPSDILFLFEKFIMAQNNPTALQNFHNNYLGVPYENIDFKVTVEVLNRARYTGEIKFDRKLYRAIMGVDQGKMFTCVISLVWNNEIIDIEYANVKRWSDVEKLEKDFNVVMTVVDAQGGGYAETRDFVAAKSHRYMCYYRPKDRIKDELNLRHEEQVVEVNRTEILDLLTKQLIDEKAHPRADFEIALNGEYLEQMLASARVIESTSGRPVWTKGKDHFFHASAYRYIAWRISGMANSTTSHGSWHLANPDDDTANKIDKALAAKIIGGARRGQDQTDKPRGKGWHIR